ncbi:MAG TPA: alpha-2-macroglobulin family protein [Anaerolineaceae bacterium]|nr:alpha-2-macroglobulin family protein [Anaerolineaceae bacterium]
MSKKTWINLGLFVLLAGAIITGIVLNDYYTHIEDRLSQQQTIVLGQTNMVPGSQAALRVLVQDSRDSSPLEGAEVSISLRPASGGAAVPLYSGKTDSNGNANVSFHLPPEIQETSQTLIIETRSSLGQERVERAVTLERDFRVLLTTDKPLYQPGQEIHIRALALSAFDMQPAAGRALEIVVADGKGNKVFRKQLTTSDYGVAFIDFQLASEVNTGDYKISAVLDNTTSEKTVTVERYVLPKFSTQLETEKQFYLPGEHVRGSLTVNYFFGKPVNLAEVVIEGYTFDYERVVTVSLQGRTDDQGVMAFEFDLPAYLAGSDLEGGLGRFYLQAAITDQAQHTETANISLPVSNSAIIIEAMPESGLIRANVDNILYIMTSYPDGAPAETRIMVVDENQVSVSLESGPYGLAEMHFTPPSSYKNFTITATDPQGNQSISYLEFFGDWSEESVLLRPERPIYSVGDTMNLNVLTSAQSGVVYLDIIREGQIVSTRSLPVKDGLAQAAIDLTPDMFGTLELHAYKILRSGAIVRDTRLVVVDQADGLVVDIQPGQETYLPGEEGVLNIQVNNLDGSGAQSALGLAVVDEAVFALAEQDPGFARLYFLLESEILQPRYDIHGFSLPVLVEMGGGIASNDEQLKQATRDAAQASLAAAVPINYSFGLSANSRNDAITNARSQQIKFFSGAQNVLFLAVIGIAIFLVILSGYSVWREKRLGRSLLVTLGVVAVLFAIFRLWPIEYQWMSDDLGSRLTWMITNLAYYGGGWITALGILASAGFFYLLWKAWQRKDLKLGWMLILGVAYIALLVLLIYTYQQSSSSLDENNLLLLLISLIGVVPLAYFLRFSGFAWNRQALTAASSLSIGLFLVIGMLPTVLGGYAYGAGLSNAAVEREMVFEDMAMPMPTAVPAVDGAFQNDKSGNDFPETGGGGGETSVEAPRLRQYFPETMLWAPDLVTNPDGSLSLPLTMADSITTWRVTALASSQNGLLGSTTVPLRVFQDFFIDLDLPLALTAGDEISIPVGIYNYLEESQTVRLEIEPADWFELLDEPVKEMTIEANDISVVYFRVRAKDFGLQNVKVTAIGSRMSDAIQKPVRVYPDGKQIHFTQSDRLTPGEDITQTINIPADAIGGTQVLLVKVYPGILSQVVEGLDSILRMPSGCFEQTSSTTYPNLLVLDYLRTTGQVAPEVEMKAEEYINLGYQRLTTFEVDGGGFSLFGEAPADRMLTAYGLQEFSDMRRVYEIDPAMIDRAAQWLLNQQAPDGSWENDQGLVHENTWSSLGNDRLPVTAYITWSLVEAGYASDPRTQAGVAYVREHTSEAKDPYVLAMVANALVSADLGENGAISGATRKVLDELAGLAQQDNGGYFWQSSVATFMGSEGQTGSVETTALAALALLRSGEHPEQANGALIYLVRQKDNFGTWYSTQATVLSLKALIQSVRGGESTPDATITLQLNGGETRTVQVNAENYDVVQLVQFSDINIGRDNQLVIRTSGEGSLMYQVTGSYYLPWDKLSSYPDLLPEGDLMNIDVAYDRTELAVNDTVAVTVTITLQEGQADSAMIDLGLPPGFAVQNEDLDALIAYYSDVAPDFAFPVVQRYELTGRQILIYLTNLQAGKPLTFTYRLRARFPLEVQTPATNAYDYYNPEINGEIPPQTLTVLP